MFGKPNKVIHISSVHCDGSETSIDQCFKKRYTLEEGKRLILNIEVVGAVCHTYFQSIATSTSIVPTPISIKGTNNRSSSTITALAVLVSILLIIVVMLRLICMRAGIAQFY